MKKNYSKLLVGVLFVLGTAWAKAQSTANYTFATSSSGSLALDMNSNAVDMTTGTTTLHAGGSDDGASSITNIGFDFWFYSNRFTQFSTTSNGLVALGSSALLGTLYTTSGGSTATPRLSPLCADLYVGAAGKVHYKLVGTAPNRCLIIEFNTMAITYSTVAGDATSTYQVRFYETTGVVEYVYGAMTRTAGTAGGDVCTTGFSVGTALNTTASVTTSANTVSNGATFNTNTYTVSSGAIPNLNSAANGSRTIYRFTPPTIANPTGPLTFTPITATSITVNWSAASPTTNIVKYAVYSSTDGGTTYTFANTTAVGTNLLAVASLTPGITYTFKVVSVSEGALSSGITGSQATTSAATYYWVGATGGDWNTTTNWNTLADGTGSARTVTTTDILIVDGMGTTAGSAGTISVSASASIGALQITSSTAVTIQSSAATQRILTLTGSAGDEFSIGAGSSILLTSITNSVSIVFTTGTGMTGTIDGTLTVAGASSTASSAMANSFLTTGGTGTIVTVTSTGIINNTATTNISTNGNVTGSAATLIFANGSAYNVSGATTGAPWIPLATWGATSTVTISGITSSATTAANNIQSFGNFTYNCSSATGTMSFWTSSTTAVIQGTLTIQATGTTGRFRLLTSGILNITGALVVAGGTCDIASTTGVVIVAGNVTQSGGRLDVSTGSSAATLRVAGTVNQTAGDLLVSGGITATANVEFNGTSAQSVTLSGTVSGPVNFRVNNTAGISLTGTMSINANGSLTVSNGNITGSGSVVYNNSHTYVSAAGATSSGTTVTVASTVGLVNGMSVTVTAGVGTFAGGTTVSSITSATTFVVSATPTTALSGGASVVTGTISGNNRLIYNSTNNPQTANAKEFPSSGPTSLTINNTNASPNNVVTIALTRSLAGTAGVLTLTAGILDNSGNVLTVTNTATGGISGGSSTTYVKGAVERNLPASLVSGSTYNFPVGKGTYNPLALFNPTTNAGGTVTVKAEVVDANAGGTAGLNMGSLNTDRYWAASITAGGGNFTNTFIRLNDASVVSTSAIASSATLTGTYDIVGSTSPTVVVGTSVTSTTTASTSIPGFYVIGIKAVPMVYTSSTTTQTVTTTILKPATNQQIIGVQIVTTGNASPLTLTGMDFNTTGSTSPAADISNARVWYTSTSSTFATTTQFGSDVPTPSVPYTLSGSQVLAEGTNYFWLVYDVPSGATVNNLLDAECTSINIGGALTPTVTAPAGTRIIKAVLSGVYSIGASQVAPNYTTLTNAITDLGLYGVSAAVTFQLMSDYNSASEASLPITINAFSGASGTNTLTINPASTVTATITGSSASSIIKLNGADYVTIDGSNNGSATQNLTISNSNISASTAVVWISSLGAGTGATFNTIKNCILSNGSSAALNFGISISGTVGGTGADNDDVIIQNNTITSCATGIYAIGTATTSPGGLDNLNINNNSITTNTSVASIGIRSGNALNASISQNTLDIQQSVSNAPVGISLETGFNTSTVSKNKIMRAFYTGTGGFGGRGITVGTGSASSAITISNNVIYGVNGDNWSSFGATSSMGIAIGMVGASTTITTTAGGINIYNNSVNMYGSYSRATACLTTALYVGSGASALDIRNNIFVNSLNNTDVGTGAGSKAYAIYSAAANTAFSTINYNEYYVSGTQGVLGFLTSDRTNLAGIVTGFGGNANSYSANPGFTTNTNLLPVANFYPSNYRLGTNISGITTDYSGTSRSNPPDVGAYEGTDANRWIGATNTVWATNSNWDNGTAAASNQDVTIAENSLNNPVLSADVTVNGLAINGTNTALGIGSNTLTINGAVSGTGTITGSSTSNLVIGGAATTIQFTPGSTNNYLKNLTLNASSSMTIGSNGLNITAGTSPGAVVVSSSATLTTGVNLLTLKSDVGGTARVGNSAGTITGTTTVERYIPSKRAWRLLTAPTRNAGSIWFNWQNNGTASSVYGVNIWGPSGNNPTPIGDGLNFGPGNSMKQYVPASNDWSNPVTNTTTELLSTNTGGSSADNKSFLLFVTNPYDALGTNITSGSAITTLRATGDLQQGDQNFTLTANTYNLIGNPYASPVDFSSLMTLPANQSAINDRFWLFDATQPGTFGFGEYYLIYNVATQPTADYRKIPTPFITGGGGAAGDYIHIQSGQAVFVQPTGAGTLTFKESQKSIPGSTPIIFNPTILPPQELAINLYKDNLLLDGDLMLFDNRYSSAIIPAEDARKVFNDGINLGILRNNEGYTVEARPEITVKDTTFLWIRNIAANQTYHFALRAAHFNPAVTAFLEDAFTGSRTPVSLSGGITDISFNTTSDPASTNLSRFRIVYALVGTPLPISFTDVRANLQGTAVKVDWKVNGELNADHYDVEYSTDGQHFSSLSSVNATGNNNSIVAYGYLHLTPVNGINYYRIKLVEISGSNKYSIIVKVVINSNGISDIVIYPNPVIDRQAAIQLRNMPAGNYEVALISSNGQMISRQTLTHSGGTASGQLQLPPILSQGVYRVQVTAPDNSRYTTTITITSQ